MRTGVMWASSKYGVEPDMLVTGKGITGGLYPISCCVVSERCAGWLKQDGFAHMSTAGGAEIGCIANFMRAGLDRIQSSYPDFFTGIRQNGVILGLEFNHPEGAKPVMKHLYQNGVWAIFSSLDPRVLQFKPGILMSQPLCEELLRRVDRAVAGAREEVVGPGLRKSA